MQIRVNSDNNVVADTELTALVESEVNRALGRFESHLTRVEVHLSDSNSHKPGLRDKRCVVEARPAGRQPVTTSSEAGTVGEAIKAAADKMKNLLQTTFGRLEEKRGS